MLFASSGLPILLGYWAVMTTASIHE